MAEALHFKFEVMGLQDGRVESVGVDDHVGHPTQSGEELTRLLVEVDLPDGDISLLRNKVIALDKC